MAAAPGQRLAGSRPRRDTAVAHLAAVLAFHSAEWSETGADDHLGRPRRRPVKLDHARAIKAIDVAVCPAIAHHREAGELRPAHAVDYRDLGRSVRPDSRHSPAAGPP